MLLHARLLELLMPIICAVTRFRRLRKWGHAARLQLWWSRVVQLRRSSWTSCCGRCDGWDRHAVCRACLAISARRCHAACHMYIGLFFESEHLAAGGVHH